MGSSSLQGWRWLKVEDIASPEPYSLVGNTFGSRLKASEYVQFGVPVLRGVNLAGPGRFNTDGTIFVTEAKADELRSQNALAGDIIFTQQGSVGQVGIIPDDSGYARWVVSQSQMKLRPDSAIADPLYIYFYFRQSTVIERLQSLAVVTGVPHINLGILRSFPILLPPLAEQRAIAGILGALDDKIELNRRMNETLEGMARALFQSWFVDFDPVRAKAEGRQPAGMDAETAALFPDGFEESALGLIPQGWRVMPLDAIAQFLNGLALQKYPPTDSGSLPVIKIAELRKGNTEGSDRAGSYIDPQYIVEDGDVLFSWSGSLEVEIWCGGRGALNQHLFKVTSAVFPKWLYYHWVRRYLSDFRAIAADKATTMGHIQRRHLTDALTVVPPARTIRAMDDIMQPLLDAVVSNNLQSRTLAATRDALLPKLLSGEVRVGEAVESTMEALS